MRSLGIPSLSALPNSFFSFLPWVLFTAMVFLSACGGTGTFQNLTQKAGEQPQAEVSDPIKFSTGVLCDDGDQILTSLDSNSLKDTPWGSGREIVTSLPVGSKQGEFHLFLDDRDQLVGVIAIVRDGLELGPYPGIRRWLTRTKKTGFIVESDIDASVEGIRHASYHLERGKKDLHSVVALSRAGAPVLYIDSRVLPGFAGILAANSKGFLQRIEGVGTSTLMAEQKDFLSIQQFASAEIARVGLCDDPNLDRAVEGYQNALNIGFQNVLYEAEAHHRTGLAYRDQEKFPQAIAAMQKSLEVRPAIAEVHHHLGTVYERMPDAERAIEAYLTAVRLRPNYLVARFHLAAAYVEVDPKRSIREFETYVALAEDRQREQDRLQRAKEHLLRLKQN